MLLVLIKYFSKKLIQNEQNYFRTKIKNRYTFKGLKQNKQNFSFIRNLILKKIIRDPKQDLLIYLRQNIFKLFLSKLKLFLASTDKNFCIHHWVKIL